MKIYEAGSADDAGLLAWYGRMALDGSIQTAVGQSIWSLAAFVKHFADPDVTVFYADDEYGWKVVTWIAPVMSGWTCGFWMRSDIRGTRGEEHQAAMAFMMQSLRLSLQSRPLMLAITTQPHVVKIVEKAGFTRLGRVPLLYDGKDCDIYYITREAFAERWGDQWAI